MVFLKRAITAILPYGVALLVRRTINKGKNRKHYEGAPKSYCPICEKASYFGQFGNPLRKRARCMFCGALERHRLLWLFLKEKTALFDKTDKKILHIAAEKCFEGRFKRAFRENYLTADIDNPSAMVKMDITDIRYADERFDVVICNHVLEHIVDDAKAMREIYRILKTGGWAILLVPIEDMDKTYEDFSIITEYEREKAFGQCDHVRKYGRDYIDRLKTAGFNVTVVKNYEMVCAEDINRYGLSENVDVFESVEDMEIFYCTKN